MRTTSLLLLSILLQGVAGLKSSSFYNRAATQANEGKPVFYTVIMGNLAFRHQASTWLGSLRKVGGWKGESVIVTDHAKCIAKTLLEANLLGPMISSNANVDIFGPAEGYTGNIHLVKRPLAESINLMKVEKARAWLNMKNAALPYPVSSIIYSDEDIVIGKNLQNFVSVIREIEKAKHTLALFRDTGTQSDELHTGVVAMFPGKATEKCLKSWGERLLVNSGLDMRSAQVQIAETPVDASLNVHESEQSLESVSESDYKEGTLLKQEALMMGPDQRALMRTEQCQRQSDHDGIRILPTHFFWLPTPWGLREGRKAEFVHFTNTGRGKWMDKKKIEMYLTKIGVPKDVDAMGILKDKQCAIPEGGTIKDVKPSPTNYMDR